MLRSLLLAAPLVLPQALSAGEKVSVTNSYVVNYEEIEAGSEVFWKEDNSGTFTVHKGPIESGFVRCVGSGFGGPRGVSGEGVCIYGEAEDTFTMRWKVVSFGFNKWQIVASTGKYSGMTGSGYTETHLVSNFLKIPHRVSDWEGEIEVPVQQ